MKFLDQLKKGDAKSLLAAFLYFDFSFMVWVSLGALGAYIAPSLGLSPSQKGLLVGLPLLSGSVFRVVFGLGVDGWGPKRTASLGLALTALPLSLLWLAEPTYGLTLFCGALLGVAGASFVAAIPLASRHYPAEQQGLVMGIAGAGNSGTVLAAFIAPRLAEWMGWQQAFGLALAGWAVVLVAFQWLASEPAKVTHAEPLLKRWGKLLGEKQTWAYCARYLVTFGGFVGLASFLPLYLVDQFGFSRLGAANLTAFCVLAGSFLRPVGGAMADKFGGISVLKVMLACTGVAALGAAAQVSPLVSGIFLVGLLGCLGVCNGAVFQLVPGTFGPARMGSITGLMGASGGLGGFLLPMLLGSLKQASGSYGVGFALWGVAALALCWTLLRPEAVVAPAGAELA